MWTADITDIPTDEGWLYLAAVEDLYSRKIVGWSMSDRIDSRLVVAALEVAIQRELPGEGVVAHSDRGVQYAREHYAGSLAETCRHVLHEPERKLMGQRADGFFFATLKKERVHLERYQARSAARHGLFEYIEVFYNRVRRHSSLGSQSALQFEQAA